LEGLNPQGCLLPSQIKASLGQTLVLFAQPEGQIHDIQEFANDCLAAILPKCRGILNKLYHNLKHRINKSL
jgi:hypothetical protein